jgi:4-hydroxybenzoate polyprenyltransferase
VQGWFEQIRLRHWAHFLLLPLATFDPWSRSSEAYFAAARGVASAFSILAFGYLLNSLSDRRMDLDARKNAFIVAGAGDARFLLFGLIAASVGLALLSPWPARLATLLCLAFGCIYSIGPRIKSIPIVGSLTNLANFGPLLFVGMQNASLPPGFAFLALAFAALLLQNQLIHEAADSVEDRRGGVRTTWMMLGPARTAWLAALLGLAATGAAASLLSPFAPQTMVALCLGVFGVGFPLLLARRGVESRVATRLRIAHRGCALLFGMGLFVAWHWTNGQVPGALAS